MHTFDSSNSDCTVFVYRSGIAAAVGHDLAIEVGDFAVEISDGVDQIWARFHSTSLRVLYAVEDGQPRPDELSARDTRKIERTIVDEVLEANRYPVITFESTGVSGRHDGVVADGVQIAGTLDLHGVQRALTIDAHRQQSATVARVRLHQPDFGIEPYRALLGALKLKADVDVELNLPVAVELGDGE